MRRKLLGILVAAILVLVGSSFAYACGSGCGCGVRKTEGQAAKENSAAIEVENKVCPVMGGAIVEGTAVKIEHEGRVYRLCCAGCISEFKSAPEKYIEKINGMIQEAPVADSCNAVQSCQG